MTMTFIASKKGQNNTNIYMFCATAILAQTGSSWCHTGAKMPHYDRLFTHLASHDRSEEKTSAQAERVDLIG